MPNYRRAVQPGGTFFLTLVTHERRAILADDFARQALRRVIGLTRRERPFELIAAVLQPDHVHLVIELPAGDADFSTRMGAIKGRFSRAWIKAGRVAQVGIPTCEVPGTGWNTNRCHPSATSDGGYGRVSFQSRITRSARPCS